jgi:GNAT superfamily N-acetyltransferase
VSPDGYGVRPFEAGDAEAVSALVAALNREEGYNRATPPGAADLRAAFLGTDPAGLLLVALPGAGAAPVVGYATGHATYETEFAARGFYVGDLYVAREHRRRGVGRALLAAMAAVARARGGRFLWWTALQGNAGGHAFYRAVGGAGEDLRAFALAGAAFDRMAGAAGGHCPATGEAP